VIVARAGFALAAGLLDSAAMKLQMEKPWQALTPENVERLSGQLGVYQLAGPDGGVIYIGFAGGKSLFGLRGEVARHLGDPERVSFRCEVNQQYQTRWRELLMLHRRDHGEVPPLNAREGVPTLGRLS
jgi:hypothetical protein